MRQPYAPHPGTNARPGAPSSVAGPRAHSAPDSISPTQILEMGIDFLRRRGILAILVGLVLGVACSYGVSTQMPASYTAEAQVWISAPESTSDRDAYKLTHIALMKGHNVLNAALDRPEARALRWVQASQDPAAELKSLVKFDTEPRNEMVSVSVTTRDPKEAQTLVNAIVLAYKEEATKNRSDVVLAKESSYEAESDKLTKRIDLLRQQQTELAEKAGNSDPAAVRHELTILTTNRAVVERERNALDQDLREQKKLLARLKAKEVGLTPAQERDILTLLNSADLRAAEQSRDELKRRAWEQYNSSVLRERDTTYLALMKEIASQESEIDRRKQEIRQIYLDGNKQQHQTEIDTAQVNVEILEDKLRQADEKITTLSERQATLQELAVQIEILGQQIASEQELLRQITMSLNNVRLESHGKYIQSIALAPLPKVPDTKNKKKQLVVIAGIGMAVFGFIVGLAWLLDFRRQLISRPGHLKHLLNVSVLGTLPTVPAGQRLPRDEDFRPDSKHYSSWRAMQEAISSLRLALTFAPDRHQGGLNSLMITSARDGEGKSTLTSLLAVSLARTGVRVVIIEADMHRPTQYSTFEVEREPGLTDVLQGSVAVEEVMRETRFPGLDLLTAGSPVDDLTSLLVADRVEPVFEYLRGHYDTILVDGPPVLAVYDTLALGQHVDQTILSVLCNYSQTPCVQSALERLASVNIPVLGVVAGAASAMAKYDYYYASSYAQPAPPARQPAPPRSASTSGHEEQSTEEQERESAARSNS